LNGYRQFQWALGTLGWDRFPVLHRILPQANGGETVPADAAGALVDLGNFMAVDRIGSPAELYDGGGGAWLSDMDRPERGETRIGTRIGGGVSLLLTRLREYRPGDFVGTVEALTTIFRACVEIDSPLRWT
jgi:hypothetical protein